MPELTQEEVDQIKNDLRIAKFQLQAINDNLSSGLTSRNLASFRNTYVINAQDSLDASYPMYVHFNIINEMIKIVSVKVSFWILNYRAYSKAGVAAGTPSGGGATSGATGSASGGGSSSSSSDILDAMFFQIALVDHEGITNICRAAAGPYAGIGNSDAIKAHTHDCPNHTHPNHTHSTPAHTHPNHTHTAVYGIFEEETSPKIKFYVSENEGISYNDVFFGNYNTNKKDLEITSLLTGAGSKLIKFESDLRARLSVQIEIKIDIKAR